MDRLGLGPVGVALNVSGSYLGEAAELEGLGYPAIWLPGGQIDNLGRLAEVAGATKTARVGSAIISADVYSPDSVSRFWGQLEETAPGRLVAGLGGPQQPRPLPALNSYLDQLDRALVDELIIWGDADTITARIRQQLQAGADHVILHVLNEDRQPGVTKVARHLADRPPSLAP